MPSIVCSCSYRISYSAIPCPDEWLFISDCDFDRFTGLVDAEDVYRATQSLLRCPECGRLWVFWNGFKQPPQEFIPVPMVHGRPESEPSKN